MTCPKTLAAKWKSVQFYAKNKCWVSGTTAFNGALFLLPGLGTGRVRGQRGLALGATEELAMGEALEHDCRCQGLGPEPRVSREAWSRESKLAIIRIGTAGAGWGKLGRSCRGRKELPRKKAF